MILSSYLRDLSINSNKNRINNNIIKKLIPNIDFNGINDKKKIKGQIKEKKRINIKKGLMEILDEPMPELKEEKEKQEKQGKQEKQEGENKDEEKDIIVLKKKG